MDFLLAWYLIGAASAMFAAWRTHELFVGDNWALCLLCGVFGPLIWTKRLVDFCRELLSRPALRSRMVRKL